MTVFDEGKAADGIGRLLSVMHGSMTTDFGDVSTATNPNVPGTTSSSSSGGAQETSPVPAGTGIAQGFGGEGGHPGIDFSVPVGTNILAAETGTVTHAANDDPGGYGQWVEITAPDGTVTRYGHLSAMNVTLGSSVTAGQAIGSSGGAPGAPGAGNATGPHLHFEVRRNGVAVDPTAFLAGAGQITDQSPISSTPMSPSAAASAGTQRMLDVMQGKASQQSPQAGKTGTQTTGDLTDPSGVDAFLSATRAHESGGDYTIYNQSGQSNASGAYQFLGSTWKGLGGSTDAAAQASPQEQDAIARKWALQLFDQFHDWRLVAIAWYGGPGVAAQVAKGVDPGSPEGQGPYIAYGNTIASMMRGGGG